MSFSNIDWSVEKTKLEFDKSRLPRASQIRQRWPSQPTDSARNALTSMSYHGAVVARSYATETVDGRFIDLQFSFFDEADRSEFIVKSLLRVSLLRLEEFVCKKPAIVRISDKLIELSPIATAFGFVESKLGLVLEINPVHAALRVNLKRRLREYIKSAPKVGRGYLINADTLNTEALSELNNEYGDVAWGVTNWARHAAISADERSVIDCLPSGGKALEVGAGSGRVTRELAAKFHEVTATDIVEETLEHIRCIGTNVVARLDDIVNSNIESDSFDIAMFWENGLGAIGSSENRKRAVLNMTRALKVGGTLLVAVRQLLPISVDHLMVAAQSDQVMGIYHTFSDEEMKSHESTNLKLESVVVGSERPAGGIEKFFIFRKIDQ